MTMGIKQKVLIAGTRQYWRSRLSELLDMELQLGLPTLFLTLSAADLHWPDLLELMVIPQVLDDAGEDVDEETLKKLCQEKVKLITVIPETYFFVISVFPNSY